MRPGRAIAIALVTLVTLAVPPVAAAAAARPAQPQSTSAQLVVEVAEMPSQVRRNRWIRVKLRVANTGTATARNVRLRVGMARGASARPRAKLLRSIEPGSAVTTTVRIRLSRRVRSTTRLRVSAASAGGPAASRVLTLRLGAKRPPRGLAGRFFWRSESRVDVAWDNSGIAFVDERWAYRGIPMGGLPACTEVTAGVDADGDRTDGCLLYGYDARSGSVTVGDQQGSYRDGDLKLGDDAFLALAIPQPGTRYDVTLVHRGFSGFCGLIPGCTTWVFWLTLRTDGQFALSSQTVATMGGGGAPFTAAWVAPPDEHGTYEVQSRGRIALAFADGSVSVRTIGIDLGDDGRPDPVNEGLLLDDTNFYRG